MTIRDAETGLEMERCCPVMRELRPQIPAEEFVQRVRTQQASGYRLAYVEDDGRVTAVAGYRVNLNLSWGLHVYVDDLVTLPGDRSQGYGAALLDWLLKFARERGCAEFHLDSGVQRFDAHRFYLQQRMDITCHHFARKC